MSNENKSKKFSLLLFLIVYHACIEEGQAMDDFTQSAMRKFTELKKELEALDAKKASLEGQVKGLLVFLQSTNPALSVDLMPVKAWPFPTETGPRKVFVAKKDVIGEHVEEMLKKQQPQMTRDLVEQLGKIGISMTGNDPVIALSAVLSRDGRFVANRKDGWSLKEDLDARDIEDLV